ncbi:hypothetical protein Hanom_Chr12g01140401 [Helianthus anomalus]
MFVSLCLMFFMFWLLFDFKLYIAFWRIIRKLVRKRSQLNATNTPGTSIYA